MPPRTKFTFLQTKRLQDDYVTVFQAWGERHDQGHRRTGFEATKSILEDQ
jgi:hypothetical protein